jgi:hypothetical protein
MRKLWMLAGIVAMAAACTDGKSPLAPTTVAAPTPPIATPPLPTTVPGVLALSMPIDPADFATTAFGLTPFGYHGADHADDGHAGWDVEYRLGGTIRAAAAGTVQSVEIDPLSPGRFTVQLEHLVGAHHYRTVYTNLATVNADVIADAAVLTGQALGTAGTLSLPVGIPGNLGNSGAVSYAMTHFQLDDLEFHREGLSSPKAVSPEPFLTPSARSLFDALWTRAATAHELIEPFATNPRELAFPALRTWRRAGGDGPAGIRFTRRTLRGADYTYELLAESGTVVETGTVSLSITARPYPFINLDAPTAHHIGIFDIVSNEMRLALVHAGTQRPLDLSAASVYRTAR